MIDKQITDLDDEILQLTWQRWRLGTSAKDQIEWERLMREIGILTRRQKELLDKQIQF